MSLHQKCQQRLFSLEGNTVTIQPEGLGAISLAVLTLSTQVLPTQVPPFDEQPDIKDFSGN